MVHVGKTHNTVIPVKCSDKWSLLHCVHNAEGGNLVTVHGGIDEKLKRQVERKADVREGTMFVGGSNTAVNILLQTKALITAVAPTEFSTDSIASRRELLETVLDRIYTPMSKDQDRSFLLRAASRNQPPMISTTHRNFLPPVRIYDNPPLSPPKSPAGREYATPMVFANICRYRRASRSVPDSPESTEVQRIARILLRCSTQTTHDEWREMMCHLLLWRIYQERVPERKILIGQRRDRRNRSRGPSEQDDKLQRCHKSSTVQTDVQNSMAQEIALISPDVAFEKALIFVKAAVTAGKVLVDTFGATSIDESCCIMALLLTQKGRKRHVKVAYKDDSLTIHVG